MHLVALLSHDTALLQLLSGFRDESLPILLHPIPHPGDLERVSGSLELFDFVGALVLDEAMQGRAFTQATRSSLDAQEVAAADALVVTPGGLIAEYNLGRAIGAGLTTFEWDPRGASVVILGAGPGARATSRELSSLGVRHLTVLAANRPLAERASAHLAATTEIVARAEGDPLALRLIENADLLVRIDPKMKAPAELMGPHLTVVDLSPQPLSPLRQQAMSLGSLTLGLRDIQAHLLALSLNHMLGSKLEPGRFLGMLQALE